MLLSRRSTLAYASAIAACTGNPVPAIAQVAFRAQSGVTQRVEHPLIHQDETGTRAYVAALAVTAPNTAWRTSAALDEEDYRAALASHSGRNYALRRVNAFQTTEGMRYAAIWQWGAPAPAQVHHGMAETDFHRAAAAYATRGLVLVHVDACATTFGPRFAGIWDRGPAQKIFTNLSGVQYAQRLAALRADGFRLRNLAGYASGGAPRFAAVFAREAGDVSKSDHAIAAAEFHTRNRAMTRQGYQLRDASGYVAGGQPYVTAIWDRA